LSLMFVCSTVSVRMGVQVWETGVFKFNILDFCMSAVRLYILLKRLQFTLNKL